MKILDAEQVNEPRRGSARELVRLAVVGALQSGAPLEVCLERAIHESDAGADVKPSTFAKSASYARAMIGHGHIGGEPLRAVVTKLHAAGEPLDIVEHLIARLNVRAAITERRESRAGPSRRGGRASADQQELSLLVNSLSAPVYATDADGRLTYFNPACVAFAGRVPELARDRWCVAWRLHTIDGAPMTHEDGPLALSVRQGRPVRGEAVAERPDGGRVRFEARPSLLWGPNGEVVAALNLLITP